MIPDSFIQDLLARVDVTDVVGRYVQLKKGGANLLGLCPFHNEKSPSFTVSPTKQFYHCFGCGAHGSAITFLIEHTGMSFPEAVRSLASSVGMQVPEEERSPRQRADTVRRKEEVSRHTQVLETAQAHYLKQLRQSHEAIRYLKQRGLTGQVAAHFGLGWSGTDRQGLSQVFAQYEDPVLVESGLVIESEDGRRYDRFRERIMFPIRNARGSLIGFGGRIIGKGEPKYLNSPETPLFSKGTELYGLWEARQAIRQEGLVIVVEGYMDVVGLCQLGVPHAVATLGTATTAQHVQKLMRASDRIVFSFDGDAAGRRAAWRALQACLPMLRDDVSIRFLFLPAEHDPDSYIRQFGTEAFRACLAESDVLSRFLLQELSSRHRLDEAEGRSACVHEALPLLAQIPETTLRIQIHNELAKLVMLTPEELAHRLEGYRAAPNFAVASTEQGSPSHPSSSVDHPVDSPFVQQGSRASNVARPEPSKSRHHVSGSARLTTRRAVTPLARRLLRLLLTHPNLVAQMGDQQLEVLEKGPHLEMVRELMVLAQSSGARHVGALVQAADPGSELGSLLMSVAADLMSQEDLPDPVTEWNDALMRIELDNLKSEQAELIAQGLPDEKAQQKYQELSQRIRRLMGAVKAEK